MTDLSTSYKIKVETSLPYETAVERTREELSKEGFGVLTEIDIKATLRDYLGVMKRRRLFACDILSEPEAIRAATAEVGVVAATAVAAVIKTTALG